MNLWAYQRGVTLDFSRPGKLTDNAFIEAFNSKLRSECVNTHRSRARRKTLDRSGPRLGSSAKAAGP
jgi:transposase InsO family protein